jgi:hypothetical protein
MSGYSTNRDLSWLDFQISHLNRNLVEQWVGSSALWATCSSEWFVGERINQNLVAPSRLKQRKKVGQVTTSTVEILATLPLELAG